MTQDPLHRLIRHLREEEHQGVLRWLRGRGGSKHALALYKAMRKEPQWDKERNLAYAESMAWNTRHLAVEKKNLYARLLKHLRRRGDGKYAIKGIYESLHDFYLLRDRGMMSLALKSLRKAGELARKSDHLELQAWISYQECLALRQSEESQTGALEKAAADYAAVTKTLATNFELLRGFNSYFSEANRYNPDVQDPKLQAFIQRYAQPFENNPRLEYDRLVFFNRLWSKGASLVPFDIVTTSDFYERNSLRSNEMRFNLLIEYLGMIDKYIISRERNMASELLNKFEKLNVLNLLQDDVYIRFANSRFLLYLNSSSKEEIAKLIVGWERELRKKNLDINVGITQYLNFATYYFVSNDWIKVLRWVDDILFVYRETFYCNILKVVKALYYKLISLVELESGNNLGRHYNYIEKEITKFGIIESSEIWSLFVLLCKIQPGKTQGNQQVYSGIVDLYHANNNLNTELIGFIEIYIWASAKVHGRDTYEEYYRLRDEPD